MPAWYVGELNAAGAWHTMQAVVSLRFRPTSIAGVRRPALRIFEESK
jgi:hypothetical protein